MTTREAVMTTQDVAARFNELAKEGCWDLIQDELYADDALSIESAGSFILNAEGMPAIKKEGADYNDMTEEVLGGWCGEPIVGRTFFSVAMGTECKMKGAPEATKMEEIAVYEVRNGKIVKEQFFF